MALLWSEKVFDMISKENGSRPLALIIDDEAGIRTSLSGVLSDEGWLVEDVPNGLTGIKAFNRRKPNIVFLDIWMPGIDGIETLQKLKDLDGSVPIVIMSGHGTIDTAVRATRLGAFEYLEKPLSIDKILPILEFAKSRSQAHPPFETKGKNSEVVSSLDILGKVMKLSKFERGLNL